MDVVSPIGYSIPDNSMPAAPLRALLQVSNDFTILSMDSEKNRTMSGQAVQNACER
jgi:hypothetical protein